MVRVRNMLLDELAHTIDGASRDTASLMIYHWKVGRY